MDTNLLNRVRSLVLQHKVDKRNVYPFGDVLSDLIAFYKHDTGTINVPGGCPNCANKSNSTFENVMRYAVANVHKYPAILKHNSNGFV